MSNVEYVSDSCANAAVESFRVSCANCERESSAAIISCVRRSASVTSLLALTVFSSFESSGCGLWRRCWPGAGEELFEDLGSRYDFNRNSRSAFCAAMRFCLAVIWALRKAPSHLIKY